VLWAGAGAVIAAGTAAAVTLTLLPGAAERPVRPGPAGRSAVTLLAHAAAAAAQRPGGGLPGPGQYAYNAVMLQVQYVWEYNGRLEKPRRLGLGKCPWTLIQEWMPPRLIWRGFSRFTQSGAPHCGVIPGRYPLAAPGTMPGWQTNLLAWRGLPTDPAALKLAIADRFGSSTAPGGFGSPSRDAYRDPYALFYIASDLLSFDAPPALRAALYEVMAHLPGVQDLGPATDRLGRHGVAVGVTKEYHGNHYRDVFIFDPATSTGLQNTVTAYEYSPLNPSSLRISTSTRVYEAAGVVDSPTATLPVTDLPTAHG
jgi:hypothetical protein